MTKIYQAFVLNVMKQEDLYFTVWERNRVWRF